MWREWTYVQSLRVRCGPHFPALHVIFTVKTCCVAASPSAFPWGQTSGWPPTPRRRRDPALGGALGAPLPRDSGSGRAAVCGSMALPALAATSPSTVRHHAGRGASGSPGLAPGGRPLREPEPV